MDIHANCHSFPNTNQFADKNIHSFTDSDRDRNLHGYHNSDSDSFTYSNFLSHLN